MFFRHQNHGRYKKIIVKFIVTGAICIKDKRKRRCEISKDFIEYVSLFSMGRICHFKTSTGYKLPKIMGKYVMFSLDECEF